jgi:hypothetical protein
LAESIVKVNNSHIITSILSTREQDVDLPNPVVKLAHLGDRDVGETAVISVAEQEKCRGDPDQSRGQRVIDKLRNDHLNSEEKKSLEEVCFDYQNVLHAGGQTKLIQTRPGILYSWSRELPPQVHDLTDYPKVKRKR